MESALDGGPGDGPGRRLRRCRRLGQRRCPSTTSSSATWPRRRRCSTAAWTWSAQAPGGGAPVPGLWALAQHAARRGRRRRPRRGRRAAVRHTRQPARRSSPPRRWRSAASGDAAAAPARFADRRPRPLAGWRRVSAGPSSGCWSPPAAHRDGWGDPVAWLREALASFERLGLDDARGAVPARAEGNRCAGAPAPTRRRRRRCRSMLAELSASRHGRSTCWCSSPSGAAEPGDRRAALHLAEDRRQARRAAPAEDRRQPGAASPSIARDAGLLRT